MATVYACQGWNVDFDDNPDHLGTLPADRRCVRRITQQLFVGAWLYFNMRISISFHAVYHKCVCIDLHPHWRTRICIVWKYSALRRPGFPLSRFHHPCVSGYGEAYAIFRLTWKRYLGIGTSADCRRIGLSDGDLHMEHSYSTFELWQQNTKIGNNLVSGS